MKNLFYAVRWQSEYTKKAHTTPVTISVPEGADAAFHLAAIRFELKHYTQLDYHRVDILHISKLN